VIVDDEHAMGHDAAPVGGEAVDASAGRLA
jgi:hypothetical protein